MKPHCTSSNLIRQRVHMSLGCAIVVAGTSLGTAAVTAAEARIAVAPETTRAIQGVSEVDRRRYFSVSDPGVGFEKRIKDDAMYDYLVDQLQVSFGRDLGPIRTTARTLTEDPARPGFADLAPLERRKPAAPSERMQNDFGPNLDVAAHGAHNEFPGYMGRFETKESAQDANHSEHLPLNIEAAAQLSAAVLKHNYTDFDRPAYYEPVNEPHWSFFKEQHLADWHLRTMEVVHQTTPGVKVGGHCMSVCYFYRGNYRSFDGLRQFIDRTGGKMDFYSFHVYDYLRWVDGDYRGRLQSGLPLEGTLDLVQNYMHNTHGREVDIVVSEHGGYNGSTPKGEYDGEFVAAEIMARFHPDADRSSWDYEMKKRSIVSFGLVSSCIANTLVFVDHPHTLKKAVPFLLVNTWGWNPRYYASLYVPRGYTNRADWVETDLTAFFKFFRGVNGRRVQALCTDPDLQTRAFVDGSTLYLAVNNQSLSSQSVALSGITAPQVTLRRFGRNADFTTTYTEAIVATPGTLELAGRESVMIVANHDKPIASRKSVNEVVCYGDKVTVPLTDATFRITVPQDQKIEYAQLRIGLTRSPDAARTPMLTLNGRPLDVLLEDSADRYVDKEYATTKLVAVNPADLKPENTVTISFPDGTDGAVGSVVLRVAVEVPNH